MRPFFSVYGTYMSPLHVVISMHFFRGFRALLSFLAGFRKEPGTGPHAYGSRVTGHMLTVPKSNRAHAYGSREQPGTGSHAYGSREQPGMEVYDP